jgi:hypothetical protein
MLDLAKTQNRWTNAAYQNSQAARAVIRTFNYSNILIIKLTVTVRRILELFE